MPKGIPNKRYTPEFKKQVVEAVIQDGLSYQEAARIYEVQGHDRIQSWERIYLEEGPEGLAVERRGREEHRQAEEAAQQSRRGLACRSAAAACGKCLPKKLASLGFGRRATPAQKAQVVQKLRHEFSLDPSAHNRSTSPCDLLLPSEADESSGQIHRKSKQKLPRFTTRTKDGTDTAVSQLSYTTEDFP